ncbi:hypothetical protein HF324_32045 [Chitinophaga oryzae]|uniref:Secreted protein n=1 Tax=Chitinophaga oryzae TaxID=2725414 RepID=A0AAE6ZN93_9BACT|nr:hypothetical protein [Chitinophaga oryzae]QJB35697.1 hypothetical protein HF329_32120 [Chitinophaga oryzae]QJB42224.1 hypothetical protein HF324_32045 [Chitinophaga oryzae]
MKFNHVLLGIVCLFAAAACHKTTCEQENYPPVTASRVEGSSDSIRFNLSYYGSRCEEFTGFKESDSSGIHVVYVKSLFRSCNCTDSLQRLERPYTVKAPGPGTYYYKWGPYTGKIDTVIIP